MNESSAGKYATAFGLSLAVTSVLSALLVIVKETNEETVLAWMKAATGHHWVSQGVLNLAVFLILGFGFAVWHDRLGARIGAVGLAGAVVAGVIVNALVIAGFYVG